MLAQAMRDFQAARRLRRERGLAPGSNLAQGCVSLCRLRWSNEDWRSAARVGGVHGSTTQDAVIFFRTTPDWLGVGRRLTGDLQQSVATIHDDREDGRTRE
jgi:hypothetical protein